MLVAGDGLGFTACQHTTLLEKQSGEGSYSTLYLLLTVTAVRQFSSSHAHMVNGECPGDFGSRYFCDVPLLSYLLSDLDAVAKAGFCVQQTLHSSHLVTLYLHQVLDCQALSGDGAVSGLLQGCTSAVDLQQRVWIVMAGLIAKQLKISPGHICARVFSRTGALCSCPPPAPQVHHPRLQDRSRS